MKCKNCNAAVPPNFIAAIADNKCPACGKRLMSDVSYKNIFKVKKQISDLGFEDSVLLGIAAALSTKYTLVPKSFNLEEEAEADVQIDEDYGEEDEGEVATNKQKPMTSRRIPNVKGMSPKTAQRIKQASQNNRFEEEDLADIPFEEEAKIRAEWGMDVADSGNVPVRIEPGDNQFSDMFSGMDGLGGLDPDMPSPLNAGSNSDGASARHAALLAKAQALRDDPSKSKVKRIDP